MLKVPRVDDGKSGMTGEKINNFFFTHHQKTVVVDAPVPEMPEKARIVAYLGGLDLTNGRWDTPVRMKEMNERRAKEQGRQEEKKDW